MRHFRRHDDTFAHCGVWMNRLADVYGVRAHFNCADHAAAQDFAVAPCEFTSGELSNSSLVCGGLI